MGGFFNGLVGSRESGGRRFSDGLPLLLLATLGLLAACGGGGGESPPANSVNSAVLSWTPVTDPTLGGYLVYYGTISGIYPGLLPVGKENTSVTVNGLDSGRRYYFAVVAYNTQGQSDFSNEVFKDIP